MATNGNLNFTNVNKVTFEGVGAAPNAVIDTTTGKIGVGVDSPDANLHVVGNCHVSTNMELGGTLVMGTVTVEAQHALSAITATGEHDAAHDRVSERRRNFPGDHRERGCGEGVDRE